MVKGTSRHVILVRSPDPRMFEEAIFIVREEASSRGLTPEAIVREAQSVASEYVRTHLGGKGEPRPLPPGVYVLLGAALCGFVWVATSFFL